MNIILKNKLTNLLTEINNKSLELATLYFSDKEKYHSLLKRLIDLRTNLFGEISFVSKVINKLNSPDFQYSKKEDIIFVKSNDKLTAILGKNIPKLPPLSAFKNSLKQLRNSITKQQIPKDLFTSSHLINDIEIPLNNSNNLFVDLKIHSYRSYEPIPSITTIIFNNNLYAYDFEDPKTLEVYDFLKTEEITCYKNNKEFLIKHLDFSCDKITEKQPEITEKQPEIVCKYPDLKYIDWRIRPLNLLKEYLLLDLNPPIHNKNKAIHNKNKEQILKTTTKDNNGLKTKLEILRETLALENNESPEFILTTKQLNTIYENRHNLFKREDINNLLKLQSPIFRSHVMDFLLLLNNSEKVYAKLCEEKKKQKF